MDEYERIREIGRGSYGSAFLVRPRAPVSSASNSSISEIHGDERFFVIKQISLAALADQSEAEADIRNQESKASPSAACLIGPPITSNAAAIVAAPDNAVLPFVAQKSLLNEVTILMKVGAGHPNICRYRSSVIIPGPASPSDKSTTTTPLISPAPVTSNEVDRPVGRNDTLLILMDYYSGGDLGKKIKRRVREIAGAASSSPISSSSSALPATTPSSLLFSETLILDYMVQLLLGLKHIHDRNIVHRDLKPGNCFLAPRGNKSHAAKKVSKEEVVEEEREVLKIGDFGIATLLDSSQSFARTRIGTPYYLAPEVCQGKIYSKKADLWSCGTLLFELLTGKHAFSAPNLNVLVVNILRGTYPSIPSAYSIRIHALLHCFLQKDPEKRPSTHQLLSVSFLRDRIPYWLSARRMKEEFGTTQLSTLPSYELPLLASLNAIPPAVLLSTPPSNGKTTSSVSSTTFQLAGAPLLSRDNSNIDRALPSPLQVSSAASHTNRVAHASGAASLPTHASASASAGKGPPSSLAAHHSHLKLNTYRSTYSTARTPRSSHSTPSSPASAHSSSFSQQREESHRLHLQRSSSGSQHHQPLLRPSIATGIAAQCQLSVQSTSDPKSKVHDVGPNSSNIESTPSSGSNSNSTPSPLPTLVSRPLILPPAPSLFAQPPTSTLSAPTSTPAPVSFASSTNVSTESASKDSTTIAVITADVEQQLQPQWLLVDKKNSHVSSNLSKEQKNQLSTSQSNLPLAQCTNSTSESSLSSFKWKLPTQITPSLQLRTVTSIILSEQCEQIRCYLEKQLPFKLLHDAYEKVRSRAIGDSSASTKQGRHVMNNKLSKGVGAKRVEVDVIGLLEVSHKHIIELLRQLVQAELAANVQI